ncbi:AraC family transcriptional regulator [Sphingobacterium olei]|uniref:AraC family transcriptional regulator n=1 Tax=Sphingobacterium olei TaxID=2571155 RepID=A0A4U0P6V0_9SPHI|nr:helix-turn-helix domain-containing protein [Sphingobacterium olei]TJZ63079.1 AraC family transcriptional regulator [Sphingobacterium olei]
MDNYIKFNQEFISLYAMPINYLTAIRSHDTQAYIRVEPSPAITAYIEGFYLFSGETSRRPIPLFNDGYPSLICMPLSDSISIVNTHRGTQSLQSFWTCGNILHPTSWYSETIHGTVLVVRFYPHTFSHLFGVSADFFASHPVCNLTQLLDEKSYLQLKNSYYTCIGLKQQITTIESFIKNRATISVPIPPILMDRLNTIQHSQFLSSRNLTTGIHYKWWQRSFKKYVGFSQKQYINLHRFLEAYKELYFNRQHPLIQIALEVGYYDDNHLIKDFKKYIGTSPKAHFNR